MCTSVQCVCVRACECLPNRPTKPNRRTPEPTTTRRHPVDKRGRTTRPSSSCLPCACVRVCGPPQPGRSSIRDPTEHPYIIAFSEPPVCAEYGVESQLRGEYSAAIHCIYNLYLRNGVLRWARSSPSACATPNAIIHYVYEDEKKQTKCNCGNQGKGRQRQAEARKSEAVVNYIHTVLFRTRVVINI